MPGIYLAVINPYGFLYSKKRQAKEPMKTMRSNHYPGLQKLSKNSSRARYSDKFQDLFLPSSKFIFPEVISIF